MFRHFLISTGILAYITAAVPFDISNATKPEDLTCPYGKTVKCLRERLQCAIKDSSKSMKSHCEEQCLVAAGGIWSNATWPGEGITMPRFGYWMSTGWQWCLRTAPRDTTDYSVKIEDEDVCMPVKRRDTCAIWTVYQEIARSYTEPRNDEVPKGMSRLDDKDSLGIRHWGACVRPEDAQTNYEKLQIASKRVCESNEEPYEEFEAWRQSRWKGEPV